MVSHTIDLGLRSFTVEIESDNGSKLSNILNWLNNIRQSILDLPSNISGFFSSLGDRISSFFTNLSSSLSTWWTNLTNSLSTWFSNVGSWFSSLGDRISNFFSSLWTNISEFFTDLFQPSDDYFDDLREDLDEFLTEHLGFVYQVPVFMVNELRTIQRECFNNDGTHLRITVPSFTITFPNSRGQWIYVKTLVDEQTYDLLSFMNDNSYYASARFMRMKQSFTNIHNVMHTLIDLILVIALSKWIYKKVINKVGISGGDEL